MVGDDTADKVGIGVPQCGHKLGERLLVELSHGAKHAFFCFVGGTKCSLIHSCHLVQANNTINWWGHRKDQLSVGRLHWESQFRNSSSNTVM